MSPTNSRTLVITSFHHLSIFFLLIGGISLTLSPSSHLRAVPSLLSLGGQGDFLGNEDHIKYKAGRRPCSPPTWASLGWCFWCSSARSPEPPVPVCRGRQELHTTWPAEDRWHVPSPEADLQSWQVSDRSQPRSSRRSGRTLRSHWPPSASAFPGASVVPVLGHPDDTQRSALLPRVCLASAKLGGALWSGGVLLGELPGRAPLWVTGEGR